MEIECEEGRERKATEIKCVRKKRKERDGNRMCRKEEKGKRRRSNV